MPGKMLTRFLSPPALTLALVAALCSPLPAQATQLCEGASRTGVYLPTVLPEEDGWTRFDDLDEYPVPADVFIDGEALIIDGQVGRGGVGFLKNENVDGLAPAYKLEMDVSLLGHLTGWLRIGGYFGALIQDRFIALVARQYRQSEISLNLAVMPPEDSPYLDWAEIAIIPREVFHTLTVTAQRDAEVRVHVDGTLAGVVEWNELPLFTHEDIENLPGMLGLEIDQAGVFFAGFRMRSAWKRIAYEICLPHNLDVQVTSTAPEDPGSIVLRGGTGQTLEGFEEIGGTLSQVTAVHRSFDDDGEGVVTLSDEEQEVVFLAATDDGTPRRLAAFDVPPGYLSQLRFHVSDLSITLAGNDYPVRVGGGAQSGIKVLFPGGLLVPEGEQVAVAVDLDLAQSLSHNQGQGFVMDPVVTDGTGVPEDPGVPVEPPDDEEEVDWPINIPSWVADLLERVRGLPDPVPRKPVPMTPQFSEVYPLYGAPGDTVTIFGTRLAPPGGVLEITFGESEPAEITYMDHERIEVLVPEHATIAPIKLHTRLGTFDSRVHFIPLEPSLPWLPAYPHRSWDISELEKPLGLPFREVHLVGDHRHLAVVLKAAAAIPEDVEIRVRADFEAALRQGPGLENMATLLSSDGADEVPEGLMCERVDDHMSLVLPLSALGPLTGQNNGSFWWMLEIYSGDETAYWPQGPPPAEREHQDMAVGVPWYRWDQVVARGASLERVEELASAAGGFVIDIISLEDLDLGVVGVVELAPEATVPHALLGAAELIDEESEDEFIMPSWLLRVGQVPSPVGTDFGNCGVLNPHADETIRWARQYNLMLHHVHSDSTPDPAAHSYSRGASVDPATGDLVRERVFVLDSGLDVTHEAFAGRVSEILFDAVGNVEGTLTNTPLLVEDFSGHGTGVTGVLAGTDDPTFPLPFDSVAGVAPEAEIVPVRTICVNCVIHAALPWMVVQAVRFVSNQADERSRVVNMSFSMAVHPTDMETLLTFSTFRGHAGFSLSRLVLRALTLGAWLFELQLRGADLLPVMAAGNNNFIGRGVIRPNTNDEVTSYTWPAAWFRHKDSALVVAATDETGIVSQGSAKNPRRADGLPVNDVAAAGRCVMTARVPANLYDEESGTSFAAPHVAGVAALIRSLARASGEPDLHPAEVYRLITRSAVPRTGSDLAEGYGVLHAYNAMRPFLPELSIEEPKGTEERGAIADLELSEHGERAFVLRRGTTDPDADISERARLVSYSLGTAGAPRQHQEPVAGDPLFVVRGPADSGLLLTILQDSLENRSTSDLTLQTALLSEPMNPRVRPVRAEKPSFVQVFVGVGSRSIAAVRSSPARIESVHERPDPTCTISGLAYAGGSLHEDPDSATGWRREERLYVIEDCDGLDGSLLSLTSIVTPPDDDGGQWFDLTPSVELGEQVWPESYAGTADGGHLVVRGGSTLRVFDSSLSEVDAVDFSNRSLWGVASHSASNAVYLAHTTHDGGHDDREIITGLHFGTTGLQVAEAAGAYHEEHGFDLRLPGRYYYMFTGDPPDQHLALARRTGCSWVNLNTPEQHQICGVRLLRGAIW